MYSIFSTELVSAHQRQLLEGAEGARLARAARRARRTTTETRRRWISGMNSQKRPRGRQYGEAPPMAAPSVSRPNVA